ncbi:MULTISPECIES: hypothetical protein [Burkholderia]|uniref:hypothetical protein n=1 Tax=Burkholderia TaxID=32008 RepID=UPI0012BCBA50|nr:MULTISPECIES: hypothetical protein [Burkholderia]
MPWLDVAAAGRMSTGFYRKIARDGTRVANGMPMRALSLQRMSAGEVAVILHLFDTAFNDARANQGDARLQRIFPVAFKSASFTRRAMTRRSRATSNR